LQPRDLDDGFRPHTPQEVKELPPIENTLATSSSLADHMMWQLSLLPDDNQLRDIGAAIIGNLNDDGMLVDEPCRVGVITCAAVHANRVPERQRNEIEPVMRQRIAKVLAIGLAHGHDGIVLAMQQAFWDKYGVAKENTVTHPITQQGTDRNPALLSSSRNEVPSDFDEVALDRYIARGNIALACNLAFDDMIELVSKKDGTTGDASRKTALEGLLPGVILQPSGVFAAIRAQDVGCKYIRAS